MDAIDKAVEAIADEEWRQKAREYYFRGPGPGRLDVVRTLGQTATHIPRCKARSWYCQTARPVKTISLVDNHDNPDELAKLVYVNKERFRGKTIVDFDSSHGLFPLCCAYMGIECIAVEGHAPSRCAIAMACIENDLQVKIVPKMSEKRAKQYDVATFGRVFHQKEMAHRNIAMARILAKGGLEVFIASISIIEGFNEYVTITPDEIAATWSWRFHGLVRHVFELKASP